MLCSVCQSIFSSDFDGEYCGRNHHPSLSNLALAASQGCYICGTIRRHVLSGKQYALDSSSSGSSSSPQSALSLGNADCSYYAEHDMLMFTVRKLPRKHDVDQIIVIVQFSIQAISGKAKDHIY